MPMRHNCSKGLTHRVQVWFTQEAVYKAAHLALTLSQELILALTLTKLVLKPIDVITKLKGGLEMFSGEFRTANVGLTR